MDNGTMMHTFKLREMFLTFNTKPLKVKQADIAKMGAYPRKRDFAMWVFKKSLIMVIDDIIEQGVQFQFPNTFGDRSWLCMQRIDGAEYKMVRKFGAYKDFDPVDTNFSAYRIEYCMEKASGYMVRIPIHLESERSKKIADLANQQKMKLGKVVTYQDYYDRIQEAFPLLPKEDMYRILRYGYFSFRIHMRYGADILIADKGFRMQTGTIYKDNVRMLKYVMGKMRTKTRILYRRFHFIWDGYSYFSLAKPRFDAVKDKIGKGEMIDFGEVMLHKNPDEAFASAVDRTAILKVKAGDEAKRFCNMEHLVTDKAEIVETFDHWDWSVINFCNRKYKTLFPNEYGIQKLYHKNIQPYMRWLEQKRLVQKRDTEKTKNKLLDG